MASAVGTATTARFYAPYGITWAPSGELFVADTLNHTIRRVTSAQIVSNFSGPGGGFGNVDATGAAARFNYPQGLALDTDDSLLIEGLEPELLVGQVKNWYAKSCFLKFVDSVSTNEEDPNAGFTDLIPQGFDEED
jgi:hypothetical protein